MRKYAVALMAGSLVGAFAVGVAVGKAAPQPPKFLAVEEVKWDEVAGVKLGTLSGDYKKGPYGALMKLPAGYVSPLQSHTGGFEAVQIAGTSSHWMRGEDGTKAKKMTPGSYFMIPAKTEHVSACAKGADCVIYIWQKTKFDALPAKDAAVATGSAAGSGSGSGSAMAATAGAGSGSGKVATPVGSAALGAGTSAKAAGGTGSGSGSGAKK